MTVQLRQATRMAGARIIGLGSYQPPKRVTNFDLAQRVETDDQWIRDRVGIVERRVAESETTVSDMAVEAGSKAIADAGLTPADLDTVIVASCTMPNGIPNAAAQTADRLGLKAPGAFDLNAACAGFCYALATGADLVRAGSAKRALVIGSEKLSDWLDWDDRSTSIIFADGAGAAVVGPAASAEDEGIGPVAWGSAGDMADTIGIVAETHGIYQHGQAVFRWATTQMAPVARRAVELAGLQLGDVDVLVAHQANLRIVEAIARRLRAGGAREDMVVADDIVYSGNTSSASIPLALDNMRAAGTVRRGDIALFVGFGAGLSYAGQVVVCP